MKRSMGLFAAIAAMTALTLGGYAEAEDVEFNFIKLEKQGAVWIAKLDNPPKNLMNAAMVTELSQLLSTAEDDESVGALVITGNMPGVFIQHYDVDELSTISTMMTNAENFDPGEDLHATHQLFLQIEASRLPVVAAINGLCLGGGYELALSCDIRFLARSGVVGLPEAGIGILPGAGGTQRLARLIGPAKALEMMLVGDVATSERAAKLGMVNRVVDDDELMDEALAFAERLAAMPRASVAEIKQLVHQGIALPLEDGLHLEQDAFWRVMTSEDAQRLMKEYAEGGQNASF